MLEAGLHALLAAATPLTAIVGTSIYPVVLPPETSVFPALTYQVVSGSSDWATDRTKFDEKRIQFDAWAFTYGEVKATLQALSSTLDGYDGTLADGTRVIVAFLGVTIDGWQPDARLYRSTLEFHFQFVEQP